MPADLQYNTLIIYDHLFINKMTKATFCKECGISLYALNKVLKNEKLVDINIIKKIASYLKIPASQMLVI
ncbi:MAG: helix-turn-helix domain-containing protein [Christensenellales bacterium]